MENYEKLQEIGTGKLTYSGLTYWIIGSFGSVSKIRRISDNKTLVWKELDYGKMTDREKKQVVSEVNILGQLNHPHIVKYYDK